MPKNSSIKPSGFIIFVDEYRRKHSGKGKNMSMAEAVDAAGELWKHMGEQQRAPYLNRAKTSKRTAKKFTAQGVPLDEIEKEEDERRQFELQMIDEVKQSVRLASSRDFFMNFYIVHVNTFCFSVTENKHYPAEVAVCKFNLQDGVTKKTLFHELCYPGKLPLGYAATALNLSQSTHQLKPPCHLDDPVKDNLETVFMGLMDFLNCHRTRNCPPLYAIPTNIEVATNVLNVMNDNYGMLDNGIRVYNLAILFYHLRNIVCDNDNLAFPTVSLATMEIERDVYEYTKGISCDFHEEATIPTYCSKSIVTRMAYIICDNCCKDADIELTPGCHVPFKSKNHENRLVQTPNSKTLPFTLPPSRQTRTFYDDDDRLSFVSLTDTDSMSYRSTENSSRLSARIKGLNITSDTDSCTEELDDKELSFKTVSDNDDGEWRGRRQQGKNSTTDNDDSELSGAYGLSQESESGSSTASDVSVVSRKSSTRGRGLFSGKTTNYKW